MIAPWKQRPRLTPALQRLVELALPAADRVAAKYVRAYGPRFDWHAAVALRLCEHAGEYEPGRATPGTWGASHAHYACRDLLRAEVPTKGRGKLRDRIGVATHSLDRVAKYGRDGGSYERGETYAARVPDRRAVGTQDADPEAAAWLLRGLTADERAVVWALVVEGRTWAEVGDTLGFGSSWINKLKNRALERLREIRTNDQPRGVTP